MTKRYLKLLYWNIHGINSSVTGEKNKDLQLLSTISEFDIVCISELHTNKVVSLPGFICKKQKFRQKLHKGPKIGGGIAIYIKSNIAKNFQLLPNNKNSESIWISTKETGESDPVRIGFFYCSPDNRKYDFLETVNGEIEKFGGGNNTYIMGDFNARTKTEQETIAYDKYDEEMGVPTNIHDPPPPRNSQDTKLVNRRGKDLLDICRMNDLIIANGRTVGDLFGTYTNHQKKGSSVIDYLLLPHKAVSNVVNFSVGQYLPNLSDHCPIQATIRINNKVTETEITEVELQDLPRRYIWTRENDLPFRNKLSSVTFKQKVNNMMSSEDSPDLVHDIGNLLTEAADECKIRKARNKLRKDAPWFDDECRRLKDDIRNSGKLLRKNPNEVSVREKLYVDKRRLRNLVRNNKYTYKKSIVDEMCQNLSNGEKKKYWNMLKKLDGPPDTTRYMEEQQLIEHFKSILNDPKVSGQENEVKENSSEENTRNDLNRRITKEELELGKKVLRNYKAPGLDMIINEMIEPLVELYPQLLLKLFNNILSNNWISEDWLLSLITAIHKKGPKEDPDNYRGISLMSCMAKLFLTILNNRLTTFALENNILTHSQLGFVLGNRTSDPHIILNNIIHKYCHKRKKKIFGCFVDFSKAFDSVPRDLLLKKLRKHGINGKLYDIIETIYSNDQASVKFGNKFSPKFRTNQGVRQGCVLSPLLFNIFLSDIQETFDKCRDNPELNEQEISCLIWADDILILSESEKGLQAKLDNLASYCQKNKLEFNTDKTKTIIIHQKCSTADKLSFTTEKLNSKM